MQWFVSYLLVIFFDFFFSSCVICFRYKKPYAALARKRKKPISPITIARFIGKIKPHETIEETVPAQHLRLAPQTRRETTHRNVQERDPNPAAGPQVTLRKESKK